MRSQYRAVIEGEKGPRGWLGVYLDVPVDWDEIADIVDEAYRMIAPKRLLAELGHRERD